METCRTCGGLGRVPGDLQADAAGTKAEPGVIRPTIRLKFEASFLHGSGHDVKLETVGRTVEVESSGFERAAHILAAEGYYDREHEVYYPPSMLGPITPADNEGLDV